MDGKWETVGPKKRQEKPKQLQAKENTAQSASESANGTSSAFAALDASWKRGEGSQQVEKRAGSSANPINGTADGLDHLTDDGGSDASQERWEQAPAKKRKPRAPKVKKPTPAAAAAQLKLEAVTEVMRSAEQRYASDERVQLDLLADHFVTVFRSAELPFNKLLAEQPLPKVAKTPVDAVPADVAEAVSTFLGRKDAAAVAAFAAALIDAAFQGVPMVAGSGKAPPKANVGLLASLALAMRAEPVALLLDAERIAAGGQQYTAPGRLPLLLWLLSQAAQSSEAVAVAVWVRVLLPQILGVPLSGAASPAAPPGSGKAAAAAALPAQTEQQQLSAAATSKAFEYLDGLLGSPAVKRDMHSGVPVRAGEPPAPLVTPAAVIALQQGVHGPAALQGEPGALIRAHQGILRTIALSGAEGGGFDARELLRLALDCAATSGSAAPDDPLVVACAGLVVEALDADSAAFAAWQTRHKGQLRGSSRVLVALQDGYPGTLAPLLADVGKRAALLALLPALRGRHQYALRTGKGWQGAAARAADAAAETLAAKLKRDGGRSALRSAMFTTAGGLGISLALGLATGSHPWEHPLLRAVTAGMTAIGLTEALQQVAVQLEPYWQQAAELVLPHVQSVVEAASPYVQQASAAVEPVVQQVSSVAAQASEFALGALKNATAALR